MSRFVYVEVLPIGRDGGISFTYRGRIMGKVSMLNGVIKSLYETERHYSIVACTLECFEWAISNDVDIVSEEQVRNSSASFSRKSLTGDEVINLMREHHKTIRGLSKSMNISMEAVRLARYHGVKGLAYVIDWLEALTYPSNQSTNPEKQL